MSAIVALALLAAAEGPRVGRDADMVQEDRELARRRAAHFGDCVVRRKRALARAYVLDEGQIAPGVPTVGAAVKEIERTNSARKKLLIGECLCRAADSANSVTMTFPANTMRHALADAIFKRDFAARSPLDQLDRIPQLKHDMFLNKFGECVVRSDPKAAHVLLSTKVVSPEENAAFGSLKPALGGCLPANSTVKINKMLIRGAVAYNYVRLANAAQTRTTSGGAPR